MASSTTNIDQLTVNQSQKEVTVNAFFDAASPATSFGRRASTTGGFTWGYYGGSVIVNGTRIFANNGTLTLTASSTNYIELDPQTGAVSTNTTAFTAGRVPIYTVQTNTTSVTSYVDLRPTTIPYFNGFLSKSVAGGVNVSLNNSESLCEFIRFTGALTANITVFVPNKPWRYAIHNATTGAFTLTVATLSGAGVVVGQGFKAILLSDGTDMIRFTADI